MIHPMQWPNIIIGVLLAEGLLIAFRSSIHAISNRNRNQHIFNRVNDMRPAALDGYRARQEHDVHAPLG